MSLTVNDFDFPLPPELIAQHPAAERTGSRMLHVCGQQLADRQFAELPSLVRAGDLLVFNDTRVIKARFFGQKDTGGQVEVLLERIVDATHAIAQVRASKSPKPGTKLTLAAAFDVVVTGRAGANSEFFALETVNRNSDLWAAGRAIRQRCRCRPTSSTRPTVPTRRATRPSMPANRAPSPPRPPGCISTRPCWPR